MTRYIWNRFKGGQRDGGELKIQTGKHNNKKNRKEQSMEITLHDMRRLVDIGTDFENKHKEFSGAMEIITTFKPRGEKVYCHIDCVSPRGHELFRYKINVNESKEGEGWPIAQIGYSLLKPRVKGKMLDKKI